MRGGYAIQGIFSGIACDSVSFERSGWPGKRGRRSSDSACLSGPIFCHEVFLHERWSIAL
ncbi:hypothetical protein B2D07_19485 [Desulfococcus multivorans]|nr:hypothetical protein B2D07_19485 [Desulfococcus multivorans]